MSVDVGAFKSNKTVSVRLEFLALFSKAALPLSDSHILVDFHVVLDLRVSFWCSEAHQRDGAFALWSQGPICYVKLFP